MRFLIQRVKNAKVEVDNKVTGEIEKGFLVLIGITHYMLIVLPEIDPLLQRLLNLIMQMNYMNI